VREWLDNWLGIGLIVAGMAHQGYTVSLGEHGIGGRPCGCSRRSPSSFVAGDEPPRCTHPSPPPCRFSSPTRSCASCELALRRVEILVETVLR
jgi:hypothetical protein